MDSFFTQILHLVEPLGLIWLGLLVLTLGSWRMRQGRLALLSGVLAVFVYLLGSSPFPGALLGTLERPYTGFDPESVEAGDAVVMLGGGIEASRYEVGSFHLTPAGDRVLMALHLIHLGKAPVLVLGGGGEKVGGQMQVESDLLKAWVAKDGLAGTAEVLSLGLCANTHDEATRVAALTAERGWRRVLLVTSANHMRRASATFATARVPVVPCPCNFLTMVSTSESGLPRPGIPSGVGAEKVTTWIHETVGWYEYRRRGWITTGPVTLCGQFTK
jgi:uncharacterized SAM-binding protein YcdF (DUF218 family)